MLIQKRSELELGHGITITKRAHGKDVTLLGAFERGTGVEFTARVPRAMGFSAVVMRICPDGGEVRDLAFSFLKMEDDEDVYRLTLATDALCQGAPSGLFYYEYIFLRGLDTLFSNSVNNVDFTLSSRNASRFHLLVYEKDFSTPAWFHGGIMYHIFPDRFCRGEGPATLGPDAVLDEDWEEGVPQYARHAGDPLSNNVFFGGNLWGVCEKLDELKKLGVTVLYLSPIFEAASNHRYDTGDYERVDGLLGGDEAFRRLTAEAHARGMRVILDGVFNHTGDDSRYFNRRGHYAEVGAYRSKQSPYADWYHFSSFPNKYEAWWGIEIMPRLNHKNPACRRYFTGKDGIAVKWLRMGADGWRLDVADELCDEFLDEFHDAIKRETGGEALLIGEVWENAVEKVAYGKRREYFHGHQLDSVMNYPFRNAVTALLNEGDAEIFYDTLTEIHASYPPTVLHSLMNLLGTHDTERILTVLGDRALGAGLDNPELAQRHLSPDARRRAIRLLKIASTLQFTVYGVPCIYYGDEAGVEGYHDPFCRMPYPWGREDRELIEHYRTLGALRSRHTCFREGSFAFLAHKQHAFAYERRDEHTGDRVVVAVNVGMLPWDFEDGGKTVTVAPESCVVLE